MRTQTIARSALAAGVFLVVGGCSESLTDVNKNPNAPTDVAAQFLLPQAIRAAVENTFADFPSFSHTSIWAQHLVELQYPDEEQGHVRPENILIGMHTVIAESDAEARSALREARKYFDGVLMAGMRTAGRLVLQKTRYYEDEANRSRMQNRLAKREAATLEEQIAGGMVLCGSPESVVQQIRRIHAELGNGIFNFTMKVGDLPDAVVRRGMELFRDRVLPQVRDL